MIEKIRCQEMSLPALLQVNKDFQTEESSAMKHEEDLPGPTAINSLECWNKPRINIWRFLATLLSFGMMGANDGAFGALIPYLEAYYDISYTVVSLIFLAPFIGYAIAACTNNMIHMHCGQRGIAIIAPCSKIIAYAVSCSHPPYPLLPIFLSLAGFGNGLEDGAWNAWVGNMISANELMGILHGAYGLGATISPLIATAIVTKPLPWYQFYYVLVGGAILELIVGGLAFWNATGRVHRVMHPRSANNGLSRIRETLGNRITWLVAVFLLLYVGVEVCFGGWLVTFMLVVRNGGNFESGLVATGYWLGFTVGRVILGFITGRIGEKLAITSYLALSMVLELLFWQIDSFVSSAVCAALLGFFLGPLFPAAIVVATKLLPRRLHVSAVGFAAAFGGGGAAIFPFAVGAIAQVMGVKVLQPIALALLATITAIWFILPGGFGFKKRGLDMVNE